MKRIAQTIRLRPERREEYLTLHAVVWPGVEAALHRANVRNYTIFRHHDVLFAYFEYHGDDFEADMAAIAADPVTQEWWKLTDPCQEPWPDRKPGNYWTDLPEIWHLDDPVSDDPS
ncbi:L-rhamnose mutarotase [Streptomyces canus]|uniref:L-rhamnose mutarotase n=1 Tax=Streptomyces canus TaxID=58343 RepID=UPI002788989F|nr:L-rhamnose mutarotase [Streptomyces canus]MDQ0595788.1 L-rhamnose mutarotase [Streptomyces canus]